MASIFAKSEKEGTGQNLRVPPLDRNLTIALAGNSNVGKSVVFNHLTGSSQIIVTGLEKR